MQNRFYKALGVVRRKLVANCPPSGPKSSQFIKNSPSQILASELSVSRFNRFLWSKPSWIWSYGFAVLSARSSGNHFPMADPSYRLSRNTVSLRRHVEWRGTAESGQVCSRRCSPLSRSIIPSRIRTSIARVRRLLKKRPGF